MAAPNHLTRQQILDLIPDTAVRLKVRTASGKETWRNVENGLDKLADTDEPVLDSKGQPITMDNHPGRRRKPQTPKPANAKIAADVALRQQFFKEDPLLCTVEKNVESEDVLQMVVQGFAREAASLEFERQQAEIQGRETSQISVRRINALKAVADTWLKRKDQVANKSIDLNSMAFRNLFKFIISTFRESMLQEGLTSDQIQVIMTALSSRLSDDTWEEEARIAMRGDG